MLARPPREIALIEIIAAIEGPVALTECSTHIGNSGACNIESSCPIKSNQQIINQARARRSGHNFAFGPGSAYAITSIKDARGNAVPPACFRGNTVSSNTDTIRELAQQEYKWGFVTDIEEERDPQGAERRHYSPDLGQEK